MHIFVILFNEVCTLTYIIGNMKQSDYNIFIEENTKVLCFNSFSNSFILISKEAYSDFQNNDLDLFAKQRPNTFQALCKSGFIIDDSIDQLAILRTEVCGIDLILHRLEYQSDTLMGRLASDAGASPNVINYYDKKNDNEARAASLYSKLDDYEKQNAESIREIVERDL